MKKYAVIGNPIAHSLSPEIHQFFAQAHGIDIIYEKILGNDLKAQVHEFFNSGGSGLNVTLPFKEQALALAQVKTKRAIDAGAANTLWIQNGLLHADNTDGIGFIADISQYVDLTSKSVLIIGAGGAARGIIGHLLDGPIKNLTITNRTFAKAQELQKKFPQIKAEEIDKLTSSFDIIINATSASLHYQTIPLTTDIIAPDTLCYDLAYNLERKTSFVQWALERNTLAIDGIGMLAAQASEAFFIWHGVKPNFKDILSRLGRDPT